MIGQYKRESPSNRQQTCVRVEVWRNMTITMGILTRRCGVLGRKVRNCSFSRSQDYSTCTQCLSTCIKIAVFIRGIEPAGGTIHLGEQQAN